MVSVPTDINSLLNKYLLALKENDIPIKEAFLFGSYAKKNMREWSDIDIALVSDIFVGDWIEDKDKIRSITLSISSKIEAIPFSPKDFNLYNPFAKEIITTGIKLI